MSLISIPHPRDSDTPRLVSTSTEITQINVDSLYVSNFHSPSQGF